MHGSFRKEYSLYKELTKNVQTYKKFTWTLFEFASQVLLFPPNLHSSSWLNAHHQEHRGHVLKNWDDSGQWGAFKTLLTYAIYEKALISPRSILLILITSIYFLCCPPDSWAFPPMTVNWTSSCNAILPCMSQHWFLWIFTFSPINSDIQRIRFPMKNAIIKCNEIGISSYRG